MKRFLLFVIVVILSVFLIARWNEQRRVPETFTPASAPSLDLANLPVLAAMDEEYTKLAEAVVPSVVSLTTSRKIRQPQLRDPFADFFERRGRRAPREFVQNSLGSGVIVSQEGHILTNHHVVADMDEVKVHLRDGREFPAKVIGGDQATDIAVLKINAEGIRPLPLADSDLVKVGSLVLAVGNPFGLQESVTHGMISATGRQVSDESAAEFFQTDTAINPGNSGGPLINMKGEIIGINSAIGNFSGTGTWQGVGFAIPSNVAKQAMEGILKGGRIVRGYLGVAVRELTPGLARQLGAGTTEGLLVMHVSPGSPAEKAGLRPYDIITQFNGKPVKTVRALLRLVSAMRVGGEVKLSVQREGQPVEITATIEEEPTGYQSSVPPQNGLPPPGPVPPQGIPDPRGSQGANPSQGVPPDSPLAGIVVRPIPPDRSGIYPPQVKGVLVETLSPDAPAAKGLRPGDVIEEINRQPIGSVADFEALASAITPGQRAMLSIARGKVRSYLIIMPQ